MKKLLLSFVAACLLLISAPETQAAQFGIYLAPKLGIAMQNGNNAKISKEGVMYNTSSFLHADRRFALLGGIAVGYDWNFSQYVPIRTELELMYRTRSTTQNTWTANNLNFSAEQSTGMNTLFANFYYDFFTATSFTPYMSAGMGFAQIRQELETELATYSDTSNHFAVSVGLGLSWVLSGDFSADLGYRYIYPVSKFNHTFYGPGYAINSQIRPTSHELVVGLRYTF